jgi:hypothetical protein
MVMFTALHAVIVDPKRLLVTPYDHVDCLGLIFA